MGSARRTMFAERYEYVRRRLNERDESKSCFSPCKLSIWHVLNIEKLGQRTGACGAKCMGKFGLAELIFYRRLVNCNCENELKITIKLL